MGDKELLNALKERLLTPTTDLSFDVSAISLVGQSLIGVAPETRSEITQWVSFARTLASSKVSIDLMLVTVNLYLQSRSVLAGKGTNITVADIAIFISLWDLVAALSATEQAQLPNLLRWFDYVQHNNEVHQVYKEIPIKKPDFRPPNAACLGVSAIKTSAGTDSNGALKGNVDVNSTARVPDIQSETAGEIENAEKTVNGSKATPKKQAKESKEKAQAQKKDVDCSISVLDIRVGIIQKVWKHPGADGLYVEEIDVGESNVRQVVSGLAKYLKEDQLMKKKVLVLTNVKPGKVRDVLSSGLVLCASNKDHSVCEPVAPPEDAPIGERIKFEGADYKLHCQLRRKS
ncbi:hypothetical protein O6H91_05G030000 [Diphasiastrum complanatum]|uniref:Uncharacterized protein n=1 Tax=Diphasiastrum complanatum TaxID=34168 RepID=A0ACC2DM05_DIPCM|nr:hypothetical protein O6H91_05G030000 [Diphasiastrum complanatum]